MLCTICYKNYATVHTLNVCHTVYSVDYCTKSTYANDQLSDNFSVVCRGLVENGMVNNLLYCKLLHNVNKCFVTNLV